MVLGVAAAAVVVVVESWDKGRFSTQSFTNQGYDSCHLQSIALKVALGPIMSFPKLKRMKIIEKHRKSFDDHAHKWYISFPLIFC